MNWNGYSMKVKSEIWIVYPDGTTKPIEGYDDMRVAVAEGESKAK